MDFGKMETVPKKKKLQNNLDKSTLISRKSKRSIQVNWYGTTGDAAVNRAQIELYSRTTTDVYLKAVIKELKQNEQPR